MQNTDNNRIDELLAAYLEGNTTPDETLQVLQAIKTDPVIRETLNLALSLELEEEPETIPMMQMAAESGKNICGVMCEAYILRRRDIDFKENELLEIARENLWLKEKGTPLHSIGQLLVHEGLLVTRKYDATFDDIAKALRVDNDIIVALDRDKLYPELPDEEDAANHAVVVTAIDMERQTVTLYDPPQPSPREFPLSTFENAWNESQHYMVRVLQSVEEYEPQPINLDNISLDAELNELIEAIAENVHDMWAQARISEGWTYGPARDDAKKQHPDLVPYSALPDGEKEYDRLMARSTIKLVKKLEK
jgi:hypothetical protein